MYRAICNLAYAAFLLLLIEATRHRDQAAPPAATPPAHVPETDREITVEPSPEESTSVPVTLPTRREQVIRDFEEEDPFDVAAEIELGQILLN